MFEWGEFKSHSGENLKWKIECDSLTKKDLKTIANMIADKYSFKDVDAPPTDSDNIGYLLDCLAKKMNPKGEYDILLVDDVLTTGGSMEQTRHALKTFVGNKNAKFKGVVLFARGDCPDWITPIFRLDEVWR